MISTALFINIIVIWLAIVLAIPAIDFAVAACRCRSHVGDVLIFGRPATPGEVCVSTNVSRGETERMRKRIDENTRLQAAARVRRNTPAADRRGSSQTASLPYVTPNGLTLTANVRTVRVPEASRRPFHPHAEYWCYGNPDFYAHA